jgi:hypothetical protein
VVELPLAILQVIMYNFHNKKAKIVHARLDSAYFLAYEGNL